MFKNKFTICVDMDDTIENLLEAWLKYLNARYSLNVQISDIHGWDMHLAYPNLDSDQIFEPLAIDIFWKTVSPKPDAIEYLRKLIEEDHQEVYICTTSHYSTIKAKFKYIIKEYFPFIDWSHFIVTANKQLINCDFLIDDGPHNLKGGNYNKILFNAPHNEAINENEFGAQRAKSWSEVYAILKEFDERKDDNVTSIRRNYK